MTYEEAQDRLKDYSMEDIRELGRKYLAAFVSYQDSLYENRCLFQGLRILGLKDDCFFVSLREIEADSVGKNWSKLLKKEQLYREGAKNVMYGFRYLYFVVR